jgi:regulatory protein
MIITAIGVQARNKDRVNVSVDGKYRFSLDMFQVIELGIKVGRSYDEAELNALGQESQLGKLYGRALEYCLLRPHSSREVKDYLYRKTRPTRQKNGELKKGVSPEITNRVFNRLVEKGYIDDQKFTRFWVENRFVRKGISQRKLVAELMTKGVDNAIIQAELVSSDRSDESELGKIIDKKRSKYPDEQKLIAYLARQGFSYDDIKSALTEDD